jgi:hypothetical protein
VPSGERWPALNVTSEELIRIKNTCVGKEGNVKIWSKMLWMMIEYILDVRAFEKEFQSSPQGETSSLTTSAVPASDEAMTKGGEAPASPPEPESIASYYASIWGLSNQPPCGAPHDVPQGRPTLRYRVKGDLAAPRG